MFNSDQPTGDDPLIGPVDLQWARNCLRGISSKTFLERYTCPALILSLREGVATLEDAPGALNATMRASLRGPTEQVGVTLVTPKDRKRRKTAHARRVTLGRGSEADITVRIATLSKHHASFIQLEDERWTISDSNSTNGTFFESERLVPLEAHHVQSGDTLLFGPDLAAMFLMPRDLIHYLND